MKNPRLHKQLFIWICIVALTLSLLGCGPTVDLPGNDEATPIPGNDETNPIPAISLDDLNDEITQGIIRSNPILIYMLVDNDIESFNQDIPVFFDNTKRYYTLRETLSSIVTFDKTDLTNTQLLNLEIAQWYINNQLEGEEFVQNQILVSHLSPTTLLQSHFFLMRFPTEDSKDIKIYLNLLGQAESLLYQPVDALEERLNSGSIPPAFAIDQVIDNESFKEPDISGKLTKVRSAIYDMPDISNDEKTQLINIVDAASNAYSDSFAELTDLLVKMREQASITGGLWTMPGGKEYYEYLLKSNCSAEVTPDEVHNLGLKEVERIQTEIRAILNELGYEDLETDQALALIEQKNLLTPDMVETECHKIIADMKLQLPLLFDPLPQAEVELEVRTDIPFRALNAGNYVAINPDYFNTRHSLQAVLFHESMPGHQLQKALQEANSDIPGFRNLGPVSFQGYIEGWALYAERLALENGFYYDKESELGYLLSDLLRAARLVVDTGLHYKEWTKEQAMAYMTTTIGETAEDEIDRYIVMPGQACSYKVGEVKLLELREMAKAELQDKFDIKEFHNVVLSNGSMPFSLLEKEVGRYIDSKK